MLLVEDDDEIAELIEAHLAHHRINVIRVTNGSVGLARAIAGKYELAILDWMLPELNGVEVCKKLREERKDLPIIFLTAKSELDDTLLGLSSGADEYMTKPFSMEELAVRVRGLIQRADELRSSESGSEEKRFVAVGALVVDLAERMVQINGEKIPLSKREFDLLAFLIQRPGRSFSRAQLIDLVWDFGEEVSESTLKTTVNRLRVKIEDDLERPQYVLTVWGFGYKFVTEKEFKRTSQL